MIAVLTAVGLFGGAGDALAANTQTLCSTGASKSVVAPTSSGACASGQTSMTLATGTALSSLQNQVATLTSQVNALQATLAGVTRSGNTLTFTHMNVQIVNGTGYTWTENGLGNLFLGYNERAGTQTGSHNLIIGPAHEFTSYGGLLAGAFNSVTGPESVAFGYLNTASGDLSSVTGGAYNHATGNYSSVTGGQDNVASDAHSSVTGGCDNLAGPGTIPAANCNTLGNETVTGGDRNGASGLDAAVSGGNTNTASGMESAVSGGGANEAAGATSSVSGGANNLANDTFTSVTGGNHNTANTQYDVVGGGAGYHAYAGVTQVGSSGTPATELITSLPVPAGNYVIQAHLNFHSSPRQEAKCWLDANGTKLDTADESMSSGENGDLPLVDVRSFSSGPNTIDVYCNAAYFNVISTNLDVEQVGTTP